jgi:hypothetical protein
VGETAADIAPSYMNPAVLACDELIPCGRVGVGQRARRAWLLVRRGTFPHHTFAVMGSGEVEAIRRPAVGAFAGPETAGTVAGPCLGPVLGQKQHNTV